MRTSLDRRVLVVVLCVAILLVVPVLALWQQWGLWRYSTNGQPNSVAISSDGSYLAVGVGTGPQTGRILFFDRAGSLLWTHDTDRVISSVAISADGSYIAAAGYQFIGHAPLLVYYGNGAIYYLARNGTMLWNYTTPIAVSGGVSSPIFQIRLSSDSTRIVADTLSGMLFLNDLGQVTWTHISAGGVLSHTVMSLDGTYVATVDDRARAFDNQGRSLWNSSIIPPTVQNIAMSPDGRYLAVDEEVSPSNATLYLYNKTGSLLRTQPFNSPPFSMTFSANDATMFTGTQYIVIAFDSSGKTLWNWTTPGVGYGVSSLAATSDGSYVLVGIGGDWEQTVLALNNQGNALWGKPVGVVRQAVLSSDGNLAAVAAGSSGGQYSSGSGSIYLLPGPRSLARDTGPVYSLLYFGQNTGLIPPAIILPAATSATLIAITVVKSINRSRKNPGAKPESPKTSQRADDEAA